MRLGKSLVVIRWLKSHQAFPALIVCPSDIIETWIKELGLEGCEAVQVRGFKTPVPVGHRWYLTSYDTLRGNKQLQMVRWSAVVLDESLTIKNPKAKITKVCLSSFLAVPHKAILTGTPAPESLLEYYCQMKFMFGQFLGFTNYWEFRAHLFTPDAMGWRWFPRRDAAKKIAVAVSHCASVLTCKDVGLNNLEIKEQYHLDMPKELRAVYDKAEQDFILGDMITNWSTVAHMWMVRITGGCHPSAADDYKINKLMDLLNSEFKHKQVVIWCAFNSEIDAIVGRLKENGEIPGIIRGDVPEQERMEVNNALLDGRLMRLVAQPKCAQFGRDFSTASASIFYSLPWDLKTYLQAKSRIAHPKRVGPILTIHLLTRDSTDEDISAALLHKGVRVDNFRQLVLEFMRKRCSEG